MLGSCMRILSLIRWELFSPIQMAFFIFSFSINCISEKNMLFIILYFHYVNSKCCWSHFMFGWEIFHIQCIFLANSYHKVVFKIRIPCPEHWQLFLTVLNTVIKHIFPTSNPVLFSNLKTHFKVTNCYFWCVISDPYPSAKYIVVLNKS